MVPLVSTASARLVTASFFASPCLPSRSPASTQVPLDVPSLLSPGEKASPWAFGMAACHIGRQRRRHDWDSTVLALNAEGEQGMIELRTFSTQG